MKAIIDIGHPAHVHLFKNLAKNLQQNGYNILFSARESENIETLLASFDFDYKIVGKKRKSTIGKILGLFIFSYRIFKIALKFKPDLFISHGSIYSGVVSSLMAKPNIALEDSGNMEQLFLSKPFSSVIISPDILQVDLGKKHIRYKGYHELSYLSPKYFTPDPDIFNELKLDRQDKYCIIRFSSWNATHDIGQSGLTNTQKKQLIEELVNRKYNVFITSENQLSEEIIKYQLKIHPSRIHDVIAFADLIISEGATIASEAGILGVPSIYVNNIPRCYNEDQENYGTVINMRPSKNNIISEIVRVIEDNYLKEKVKRGRDAILRDKIDVTGFLVWFIQKWPESFMIMKDNPDYQYQFK